MNALIVLAIIFSIPIFILSVYLIQWIFQINKIVNNLNSIVESQKSTNILLTSIDDTLRKNSTQEEP